MSIEGPLRQMQLNVTVLFYVTTRDWSAPRISQTRSNALSTRQSQAYKYAIAKLVVRVAVPDCGVIP